MWLGDFILFLFLGMPPNSSIKRTGEASRLFQALGILVFSKDGGGSNQSCSLVTEQSNRRSRYVKMPVTRAVGRDELPPAWDA